jgi:glutamate carboxypeptidase
VPKIAGVCIAVAALALASASVQGRAQQPPAPGAQAPNLSRDERRIAAWVDAHTEEAIGFLERTVNVNSGTLNLAGVREVARLYQPEFEALGFTARWIPMPDSVHRAGHLFAERAGTRGKRVLFIGHLDTVYEADSPFQRFVREGDRATGPGTNDMKGGNAVILYALKALAAAGALDGTRIIVAFTGDEESVGRPHAVSRRDLVEAAQRSDVSLEYETAVRDSAVEYGTVARRGATGWRLETTGRTAHTSGIFSRGAGSGAIFEAARILHRFHEELREQYVTFSAGVIVGGTEAQLENGRGTAEGKGNVVPRTVLVNGDLRTLYPDQEQRLRDRMRAIVAEHLPQTGATIVFQDGYPPMAPTPGNQRLFEMLNVVTRDMGLPPMQVLPPEQRGASDASFAAPYTDVLSGLGAYGGSAHAPGEWIDLASFALQIKRTAVLLYRLTR